MESNNKENKYFKSNREEKKLSNNTASVETITATIGNRAIPIEDFKSVTEGKELPFTAEDQDIHNAAALKFIEGYTALRKRVDGGTVNPIESQAEENRLKEEYKRNIQGMSTV